MEGNIDFIGETGKGTQFIITLDKKHFVLIPI